MAHLRRRRIDLSQFHQETEKRSVKSCKSCLKKQALSRLGGISSAFPKGKQDGRFFAFHGCHCRWISEQCIMNAQPDVILGFFLLLPCCLCNIRVYVGYYLTSKKVGAAHSPFGGNGTTPLSLQTRRVSDRQDVFFHALSEMERSR